MSASPPSLPTQVILEGLEANVRRGCRVAESGHTLILGWCHSQRDLEVVRKVLAQACLAYRAEGGTTVRARAHGLGGMRAVGGCFP